MMRTAAIARAARGRLGFGRTRRAALSFLCIMTCFLAIARPAPSAGNDEDYRISISASGIFVIRYPEDLVKPAREMERLLEKSSAEIAGELGLEEIEPIEVYLAPDGKTFSRFHGGRIPDWGVAFSDLNRRSLVVNVDLMSRNPVSFMSVVRHELSHLLLAQRVGAVSMPTWLMEGIAMSQAHEWGFAEEWRFMLLVGRRKMPYLEELRAAFPRDAEDAALAYGLSYVAVTELLRDRPGAIMTLTSFMRDTGNFNEAFVSTFGLTAYDFGSKMYASVYRRYKVPGTLLNAAPYWGALAFLFVAVYALKRRRSRRKLQEWEAKEEGEGRIWY